MFEKLKKYLHSRLPVVTRTVIRDTSMTRISAGDLDVDTVHAYLSAADNQDPRQLFALYEEMAFDGHIQTEFSKRKLAVLGDQMNIVPVDKNNVADLKAAEVVKAMTGRCSSFFDALSWLLDGTLFPVAVVEKVYSRARVPGLAFDLEKMVRVPPDLFDYSTNGKLRIRDTTEVGDVSSTTHDCDPMSYIKHRGHLMTAPDYRGGPMRCLVFWWLFSNFDREWWVRFLDRYGSPFLLGKYDQSDDYSRVVLENAFSLASKLGGLAVSRETDVEIKEAMSKSGGEAFGAFHSICQREKSKLILGQTTSAEAQSTGMNSDMGKVQAEVRSDIRMFDAITLGNTLRHQLFQPWLRINGIAGNVMVSWGAEKTEDTKETAGALASLSNAGVELTNDGIEVLSNRMNLGLQRKSTPVPSVLPGQPSGKPPLKALAARPGLTTADEIDAANLSIARAGSAELARAFSGAYAPIRLMILESTSPQDLEVRIRSHYADWPSPKVTDLLEQALTTFAANGVLTTNP